MLQIKNWRLFNLTIDLDGKIISPTSMLSENFFDYFENPSYAKNTLISLDDQGISLRINVNGILRYYSLYWKIEKSIIKILAVFKPSSYEEIVTCLNSTKKFENRHTIKLTMNIDSANKKICVKIPDCNSSQTFNVLDIISSEKNIFGLDFAGRNSALNFFSDLLNMRDPSPIMFKSKFHKNTLHLFLVSAKKSQDNNSFVCLFSIIDEFLNQYDIFFNNSLYYELPNIIYRPTFAGFVNSYLGIDSNQGILGVIDIDNFSVFNGKYTIKEANIILREIVDKLSSYINKIGSLTNLQDDRFVFFIPDLTTDMEIDNVLSRILDIVHKVKIESIPQSNFTATIGISCFPQCGKDFETLLKQANNALFQGKFLGKNRYVKFDASIKKYNDANLPELSYLAFFKDFFHILLSEENIDKAIDSVLSKSLYFFKLSRIFMLAETLDDTHVFSKFKDSFHAKGVANFELKNIQPYLSKLKPVEYIDTDIDNSEFAVFLKTRLNFTRGYIIYFFEDNRYFGLTILESEDLKNNQNEKFINLAYLTIKTICSFLYNRDINRRRNIYTNKDPLTSSLNLTGFNLAASELMKKNTSQYSIISFDIKNFSFINDFYGYSIGNKIIQFIAISLKKLIHKDEEICHISADNFLILLHETSKREILMRKTIIFDDIKYFKNNNLSIHLHYSIGAYIMKKSDDLHHAIDYANKARIATKVQDFTAINFYTQKYREKELMNKQIEMLAEEAVKNKEFYAVYQPCFDARTTKIVSGEALVRWKHEDKIFYPNQFIPYLEKTGLIVNMDFIIYEKVCQLLQSWHHDNIHLVPISINVSRSHLLTGDFVERLENLVNKYNIERKYLCLEITESMFVSGKQGYDVINELHSKGYRIFLDDFGTAYSNLKVLSTINFDVIKIDKSLVDNICVTKKALTIFKSVIAMSKALGLKILVEGVENPCQLKIVMEQKCDIIQGYIFSKAVELDDFDHQVRNQIHKNSNNN